MRILWCFVRPEPGSEFIHILSTPPSQDSSTNLVRSWGSQPARPPGPTISPSDLGPSGPSKLCFACPASLRGCRSRGPGRWRMSEMWATWRRPTSAAPRGALARPPPCPRPRDHPGPKHFRLSGPQPLQAPRPADAGTAPFANLQAVGAGRRASAGPCPPSSPAAQPGCPGPCHRSPALWRHPSRRLLSSPRPSPSRHSLGRRACSAGPRAEAACRSPGAVSVTRAAGRCPASVPPSLPGAARRAPGGRRRHQRTPGPPRSYSPPPRATCAEQAPHPPGSQLPPAPEGASAPPPPARRARCSRQPTPASSPSCFSIRA